MLEINNYSNFILKDISFKVKNKNIIILGSNGAGKTTLAKVLSGLISSVNVCLENTILKNIDFKERVNHINYIPPKLEVFDNNITVKEFLNLNIINKEKNLEKVLSSLNIKKLESKSCKLLSSGESQLVLIASAILHNAKYTILDEPTANLDPEKLKNVFRLLSLKETMQNKIIITHNLNFAYKLGYDIIFIKDGNIAFNGTSQEFFSQENLDIVYNKTVEKISNNIVVNI